MTEAINSLRQHQLVILRRLRTGPLTEFELAREVAEHSGFTVEQCAERVVDWLEELKQDGLIWTGPLENSEGQRIAAAALTKRGMELVG